MLLLLWRYQSRLQYSERLYFIWDTSGLMLILWMLRQWMILLLCLLSLLMREWLTVLVRWVDHLVIHAFLNLIRRCFEVVVRIVITLVNNAVLLVNGDFACRYDVNEIRVDCFLIICKVIVHGIDWSGRSTCLI